MTTPLFNVALHRHFLDNMSAIHRHYMEIKHHVTREKARKWKQKHKRFKWKIHCNDVIMGAMASQVTSLAIVYSTVYSGVDQIKHQSSASLSFVRGIHRWPVNSPHKGPVRRKMFPFDDVIMLNPHSLPWLIQMTVYNSLLRGLRQLWVLFDVDTLKIRLTGPWTCFIDRALLNQRWV